MKFSRRSLRFAVPATVMASTFAFVSVGQIMSADAQIPNLPSITAQELLAKVATAQVPAFSGSVKLTSNLGLPDLGGFGGSEVPSTAVGLLSGTHSADIASDGPKKIKVTMTGDAAESSWIRNGADAWAWKSTNQSVKHAKIDDSDDEARSLAGQSPADQMNPAATANILLASVEPSTTVSVRTSAYVADRAAYELVLTPKSTISTISEVVLSVDAATGMPLEARVIAKGVTKPAMVIGFTSIKFETSPASTFVFTPPPGATVTEVESIADLLPLGADGREGRRGRGDRDKPADDSTKKPAESDSPKTGSTVGIGWDMVQIMDAGAGSEQFSAFSAAAKTVTLKDGTSAKMLSTTLINALFSNDGRIAFGAVNQAGLEAALAATPS